MDSHQCWHRGEEPAAGNTGHFRSVRLVSLPEARLMTVDRSGTPTLSVREDVDCRASAEVCTRVWIVKGRVAWREH